MCSSQEHLDKARDARLAIAKDADALGSILRRGYPCFGYRLQITRYNVTSALLDALFVESDLLPNYLIQSDARKCLTLRLHENGWSFWRWRL